MSCEGESRSSEKIPPIPRRSPLCVIVIITPLLELGVVGEVMSVTSFLEGVMEMNCISFIEIGWSEV